jgi:c-di-GMP-related signal transduction protein
MEVFVARQPIFDRNMKVYGYELFFRYGGKEFYDFHDGDQASSRVMTDGFFIIGMEKLTEGKKAFINFTHKLLLDEVATIFPREQIAVEVLETVEPDPEIFAACDKLKEAGYLLVLDDFAFKIKFNPLIELADIIKIDFLATSVEERRGFVQWFGSKKLKFLAEKVETREEFDQAVEMGYSYFQGYFFSKPVTLSGQDVPSYKVNYVQVLREVHKPELDFDELENIFKRDVAFSYKLLRCINSAYFGLRAKVESIKHALILMGMIELRKWVSLIAVQGLGEDKPQELLATSIIRARFCELLAPRLGQEDRASDLFLMGMFSLLDAFVDRPLAELLEELPISDDIKDALLEREGPLGKIYELVLAYERGNWGEFSQLSEELMLDEKGVPALFHDSLEWTQPIFSLA